MSVAVSAKPLSGGGPGCSGAPPPARKEHIMKMIESMVTDKKQSQRYQIYGIEYAARHLGKVLFQSANYCQRSTSIYSEFDCYNCS